MDKLTRYRQIVRQELQGFADWAVKPGSGLKAEVVHDPVLDHFALVYHGFDGRRHVHRTPFHLDLIGGKVWVQYDGTDRPIAEALADAGIPKEDIVLGFYPPEVRPQTGYGVG